MKKNSIKLAGFLSVAFVGGMIQACGSVDPSVDSELADESFGQVEQGVMNCANPDGTNSVMAALAVATAQELKRWQPSKDFVVFGTSGKSEASGGPQQAIKLTSTGKGRCSDGRCAKVQALLDMQYDQANNKITIGNQTLNPGALRARLVAKLREQATCEQRPANGGNNCPVEEHTLTFQKAVKGGCDTNFFFKAAGIDNKPLKYPAQLKNKLMWVDTQNPYVQFQAAGDIVSIDPTYGLNEDNTNSAGSCVAACTKITTSNAAGQCCSCKGATKKFAKSAWNASTFLCQ
ncbi:MAG: hypothetical protein ABW217_03075 [Polyangiaceae bacterium]